MTTVINIENRNRIGILRFNRPGVLNALSVELAQFATSINKFF